MSLRMMAAINWASLWRKINGPRWSQERLPSNCEQRARTGVGPGALRSKLQCGQEKHKHNPKCKKQRRHPHLKSDTQLQTFCRVGFPWFQRFCAPSPQTVGAGSRCSSSCAGSTTKPVAPSTAGIYILVWIARQRELSRSV